MPICINWHEANLRTVSMTLMSWSEWRDDTADIAIGARKRHAQDPETSIFLLEGHAGQTVVPGTHSRDGVPRD